jgi:hypothetical protein
MDTNTNHKEHTMNATDRNTETSEETFAEWAAMQPIRTTRMDQFVQNELDGDESRMIRVTRLHTPFGTFTRGMEAI